MKYLVTLILLAIICGCASPSPRGRYTDKSGILSIVNPPVTEIGTKVIIKDGLMKFSDDLGHFTRLELQFFSSMFIEKKLSAGGIDTLLDSYFDSGYYPRTYGAVSPPGQILLREHVEIGGRPILFVCIDTPNGSTLVINGKRADSKRFLALYLDRPVCVILTFEANTLDAKALPPEDEIHWAKDQMTQLIDSVTIDKSMVPKE